jgi:hypothetical protein
MARALDPCTVRVEPDGLTWRAANMELAIKVMDPFNRIKEVRCGSCQATIGQQQSDSKVCELHMSCVCSTNGQQGQTRRELRLPYGMRAVLR